MAEKRSVVAVCAVRRCPQSVTYNSLCLSSLFLLLHKNDAKPPPSKGSSVVVQSTNLIPEFDPGKGLYSTFFFSLINIYLGASNLAELVETLAEVDLG